MRTVLITGGAGSLGRAFCRLLHEKYNLIVIDNSEWAIAELQKELPDIECHLMDFSEWKFNQYPCEYLLHLAAYKHVNLGETEQKAFIDNNINKTLTLFEEAYKYNVEVMFMSTDKAVEPISLYGYTKAIGEQLARKFDFAIARCGNILSSSGSVIPTWEHALKNNHRIPITDERMVRYFIEDFEAASQIWDRFLSGHKLIIPQCQKIRILDLLTKVIERHHKKLEDVTIEIIGLRKGEKLEEKLRWEHE